MNTTEIQTRLIRDAERFRYLQSLPAHKAQAFFWNYTSRRERAKAIDVAMAATKEFNKL